MSYDLRKTIASTRTIFGVPADGDDDGTDDNPAQPPSGRPANGRRTPGGDLDTAYLESKYPALRYLRP